jgi:hypothetical protein
MLGFLEKTDSTRFNIKKQGLSLISFRARYCLFNLLLLLAISAAYLHTRQVELIEDF